MISHAAVPFTRALIAFNCVTAAPAPGAGAEALARTPPRITGTRRGTHRKAVAETWLMAND